MNLYRSLLEDLPGRGHRGTSGVAVGIVTNNEDPENRGRIKVKYPWLADDQESSWARIAAPVAGKGRGFLFLPEVGDEVLVAFEQGDMDRPYVVGTLWSGVDAPPVNDGDGRDRKVLRSRSGHLIRLDDTSGAEKIEIIDKSGRNAIVIDAVSNSISVTSESDIDLRAPKGKVRITAQEVEVSSSASSRFQASGTMTLKGATVNIN